MAVGRPHGDAINGAVLVGRKLTAAPLPCLHTTSSRAHIAADLTQLTVLSRACGRRLVSAAHSE
eukprot:7097082-Prymnesium_polylepis.1